jgi:hypothetical protein
VVITEKVGVQRVVTTMLSPEPLQHRGIPGIKRCYLCNGPFGLIRHRFALKQFCSKQCLAEGEINIEELRIGDNVLAGSGDIKPIKFIGRRKVSRERTGPCKTGEGPVKISCFAIDGKVPHSDLYVSPWHAIYIDNILIPAKYLVNGVTIVADAKPEALALTYFHIELDTHEAILAEGLAVESFLRDDPHAFDNADEYVRLYGTPEEPLTPFAPYIRYSGRQELASHIRSALAPVYDFRKPTDKVRDRIADRAEFARAA